MYDRPGRSSKIIWTLTFNQDPTTQKAWRRYTYDLGSLGVPSRIQTEIREPGNAGDFRSEHRFYDGLGRLLETKVDGMVDGVVENTVREAFGVDDAGRVTTRYAPFRATANLTTYETPTGAATTSVLDALDRVKQVTKPDDNVITTTYDPAGTTDIHDENYVACNGQSGTVANASCPGKRIVEIRDALGRI